jgi:hypothetical protein
MKARYFGWSNASISPCAGQPITGKTAAGRDRSVRNVAQPSQTSKFL